MILAYPGPPPDGPKPRRSILIDIPEADIETITLEHHRDVQSSVNCATGGMVVTPGPVARRCTIQLRRKYPEAISWEGREIRVTDDHLDITGTITQTMVSWNGTTLVLNITADHGK